MKQAHEPHRAFHIEHVIARQHGGSDDDQNLALACHLCNWLKEPNLASLDPDSGQLTRLFHPRQDVWTTHFRFDGPVVKGLTDIGRTTVWLLDMNHNERIELRRMLIELEQFD